MKRCPQCNRVESDEALKFCRVDGATLVGVSSPLESEAGTIQLASPSTEIKTNELPDRTAANINRATNGARLMMIGRYDESLAAIQRALDLDPTSNGINFYKGTCLAVSGRRAEAIQHFKKIIEMDPSFPWAHAWLARVYGWNGDYAASVDERAISLELDEKSEKAKQLREIFAREGWAGFQKELRQNNPNAVPTGELDQVERDTTIERLQRQAQEGSFWLFLIKVDPMFDPLRGDPRFQALVKKFDPPQ